MPLSTIKVAHKKQTHSTHWNTIAGSAFHNKLEFCFVEEFLKTKCSVTANYSSFCLEFISYDSWTTLEWPYS